jgi:hypothetical protein
MMENASVWRRQRTPYIHCNLLISFIYSIDQKKVFGKPYLAVAAAEVSVRARSSGGDGGGGWRRSSGGGDRLEQH